MHLVRATRRGRDCRLCERARRAARRRGVARHRYGVGHERRRRAGRWHAYLSSTGMPLPETSRDWHFLYAALVFAIAAFFLFSLRSTLTPLIAYVLFVLLLVPYAGSARHTTLLFVATLALSLWLLESTGSLLAPFVLAFVIAYILDPAVDALE